jgi:hypothetical protein
LSVVVETGERHQRRVSRGVWLHDFFDEILALADADDLARLGRWGGIRHRTVRSNRVSRSGKPATPRGRW